MPGTLERRCPAYRNIPAAVPSYAEVMVAPRNVTADAPRGPRVPGRPRVRDTELLGSVRNAARVLRAFGGTDAELGVTELSRRLRIGKSTVHRIVSTLTSEHLLERGRARGTYRLGLAALELGTAGGTAADLHQAALPVLATLRHATDETVLLAVLDRLDVVVVERLERELVPASASRRGATRLPAPRTSSGLVLLAALAPEELARRLDGLQPSTTPSSPVVTRERLLAELAQVSARGFAVTEEDGSAAVVSVAAPVRGPRGEVLAAMAVVGEPGRMHGAALRQRTALLLESASTVSKRLGRR